MCGLNNIDKAEFLGPDARDSSQDEGDYVGRDRRLRLAVISVEILAEILIQRKRGIGCMDMDGHHYLNANAAEEIDQKTFVQCVGRKGIHRRVNSGRVT
uniref:Uncharacterized protein n=1 Tax=Romanomermis culicivorax TaxID=13658 RepID=A0A915K998_ROMCU